MIFFASERKTNYFFGRSPPKKNHIFARYLTKLQAYDSSNFRYSNSVAHYTDDGLQSIYFIGPETPAILGSVAAIIAMLIYNKLFIRKESDAEKVIVEKQKFGLVKTLKAWSVYGLIIFFILISSKIVPSINELLNTTLVTKFDVPVTGNAFKFGWLSNADRHCYCCLRYGRAGRRNHA